MMQSYSVSNMVKQVRLVLDRNSRDTELSSLGDIDTLDLDEIIKSKFYDALWVLFSQAPIDFIGMGEDFSIDDDDPTVSRTIVWEAPNTGRVQSGSMKLPNNFLRLITFKMSDWSVPVTEAINETSPAYLMQQSKFSGIRGNPEKPVVAIVTTGERSGVSYTERHLEFYCSNELATIERARYLPIPTYSNSSTNVFMPDRLNSAFVYQVAELVAITLGDANAAQSFGAVLKQLLVVR